MRFVAVHFGPAPGRNPGTPANARAKYRRHSEGGTGLPAQRRGTPVDPFQEHRQLRRCQRHLALPGRGPDEPAPLKPLHEHAARPAIPPDDLYQISIAVNLRREVTAAVLWLLSRGIEVKCVKVTPFELEQELIIDIQQIIPTPF